MKGQDLLLLLKLVSLSRAESPWAALDRVESGTSAESISEYPDPYSVRALEESTGISKSEVSGSLRRCAALGLLKPARGTGQPQVNTRELYDVLAHGLKYFFPARPGALRRGIPSAFAAPVLAGKLMTAGEHIYVWEDGLGKELGQRVEPLYKSVPYAVRKDPELYALLALIDSIRLGQAREAGLARQMLEQRLRGEAQ
jgi:hypothetical protein